MYIPKRPVVPSFIDQYTDHITEVVFGTSKKQHLHEAIFLFGASHPGIWKTAINEYQKEKCKYIFITGGFKKTANRHDTWVYENENEADVIERILIENGIPKEIIIKENMSTNSLENVLFIKEEVINKSIKSIMCICKNYGAGRQYRTIKKCIPNIDIEMNAYETNIDDHGNITREKWILWDEWRALVWGEYLRNYYYGVKGDIEYDFIPPKEILEYLVNIKEIEEKKT